VSALATFDHTIQ